MPTAGAERVQPGRRGAPEREARAQDPHVHEPAGVELRAHERHERRPRRGPDVGVPGPVRLVEELDVVRPRVRLGEPPDDRGHEVRVVLQVGVEQRPAVLPGGRGLPHERDGLEPRRVGRLHERHRLRVRRVVRREPRVEARGVPPRGRGVGTVEAVEAGAHPPAVERREDVRPQLVPHPDVRAEPEPRVGAGAGVDDEVDRHVVGHAVAVLVDAVRRIERPGERVGRPVVAVPRHRDEAGVGHARRPGHRRVAPAVPIGVGVPGLGRAARVSAGVGRRVGVGVGDRPRVVSPRVVRPGGLDRRTRAVTRGEEHPQGRERTDVHRGSVAPPIPTSDTAARPPVRCVRGTYGTTTMLLAASAAASPARSSSHAPGFIERPFDAYRQSATTVTVFPPRT
jgi:hypothetical protein